MNYLKEILRLRSKRKQEIVSMDAFAQDLEKYNQMATKRYLYPCLNDATSETNIEPIYFYQDTWAFEQILKNKPTKHVDIGSQHKFVAFLSKVVELTMVDIRPLSLPLDTIQFEKGSITELPFEDNSIQSLSSLCVVEHIGLGRYGDPLDPYGSEKSLNEITRVLQPEGFFYFSVPVSDKEIVAFNAGRIFNHDRLLTELDQSYDILEKAYIHGNQLIETFIPNDRFGTTILLALKKKI
jgi:SAM-dependent methyltransferase